MYNIIVKARKNKKRNEEKVMKKFLGFIIFTGFMIMLGAAGGAENPNTSFAETLGLEILGMTVFLGGISALSHYKRYRRRALRSRKIAKRAVTIRAKERKSYVPELTAA